MSEPMSRLGADVTGIDASLKNIKIAEAHQKKSNLQIRYLNTSPEQLTENEKFDVILNLEIVEHVEDVDLYFKSCAKLLKKNIRVVIAIIKIFFIKNYLLGVSNIKKYPNKVDNNDPVKTPILTPSIYSRFSTKAKFPTNKLMVKPIPVKTPTP